MKRISELVLILIATTLLAACGGGGGGGAGGAAPATGPATLGVLITDAESDDYDEAIATITEILLLCENGPQEVFEGSITCYTIALGISYQGYYGPRTFFVHGEFRNVLDHWICLKICCSHLTCFSVPSVQVTNETLYTS